MIRSLVLFLVSDFQNRSLHNALATMARFVFVVTIFMFFWNSALTKFDGFLQISDGANYQIYPKAFEAAGFNAAEFPFWRKLVVWFGSVSEVVLPMMIALGFLTRPAALGMIGFTIVMTWTDVTGHGVALGSWFDSDPASLIADLRLYWLLLFSVLVVHGGGWLSVDRLLKRFFA